MGSASVGAGISVRFERDKCSCGGLAIDGFVQTCMDQRHLFPGRLRAWTPRLRPFDVLEMSPMAGRYSDGSRGRGDGPLLRESGAVDA